MNIDIQGKSYSPFLARDSNPGSLDIVPGGVGRNIAENLARLGARVELMSVLGDDDFSRILEDSCASVGIGLSGCLRLPNSPASRYLCLLDADGSLVGAVCAMDTIDGFLPERLAERAPLLDQADLVLVDANLPEASIAWLAARYPRGTRKPLLGFDPVSVKKSVRGKASLGSFAFAKPNREEAAVLTGLPASTEPAELAKALRATGVSDVFLSLGTEGLLAEGPAERWLAHLPQTLPSGLAKINASGAGDAATAAIAWTMPQNMNLGERCSLALAAAMLTASCESPVNSDMCAARLYEVAKGIECERVS
jgi:pseudouridine kinase